MLSTLAARADKAARLVAAALLLGLGACAPNFGLQGGEQITCEANEDCPEGTRCSALKLCVVNTDDTTAPLVERVEFQRDAKGTKEWTPSEAAWTALGPSAGFALEFEVNEPLLTAPRVTLGRGGEELSYREVFQRDALHFRFELGGGDGDAGSGRGGKGGSGERRGEGVYAVWASLVDASGNPAEVQLGTVEFDYTNPRVVADTVSVTLTPGPGNPLPGVKKVANGTRIQIAFTLSEKLPDGSLPQVWTELGGAASDRLDFWFSSSQGNTWVYQADFASAAALEACPAVFVEAIDAAGNGVGPDQDPEFPVVVVRTPEQSPLPPHLCFDTVAPQAPGAAAGQLPSGCSETDRGALSYRRIPWGRGGADAEFRVHGPDCAMEPDETVIAYDRGTRASASELGRARSTAKGALDLELSLGDRERVYVAAADDAGNLSPLRLVEDVEWVATLGKKIAGSRLQNPTVFSTTALLAPTLAQDPSLSSEAGDQDLAGLQTAGGALVTRGGEQAWRPRSHPGEGPVARAGASAAFDTWRGRLVVFGGSAADGRRFQDTWEYVPDSAAWIDRTPAGTRPPARRGHATVFDGRRGKVIVFGGTGGSVDPASADVAVWEWDGATGLWTQRPASKVVNPGVRLGHAMAYDPVSGKVLLFGGHLYSIGADEDRNDLWSWDPRTNLWSPVPDVDGVRPTPRQGHAMAYDPVTRKVYVHGGLAGGVLQNDLWTLDPATLAWERVLLADSPEGRSGHALLAMPDWSKTNARLLLFGGSDSPETSSATAWLYDGTWNAVSAPVGAPPRAREGFAAGYDPVSRRVLVFGGTQVNPGSPLPVETLLGDTLDAALDDAHRADWTQRSPRAADPEARSGHLLALAGPGRAILYGGMGASRALNDTWFWSERAGAWEPAPAADVSPPARSGLAAACKIDPSGAAPQSTVFAFGGEDATGALDELWTWDATSGWGQVAKDAAGWPQPRKGAAMVWDSKNGQLVLFGGRQGASWPTETWTSPDGKVWSKHVAGAGPWPDPREGASMSALPDGKVALFGGRRSEGELDLYDPDLWEWDGGAGKWVRRGAGPTVEGSVQTRAGATLLPSLERGRLLLFGGEKASAMQDPWELEPTAPSWTTRAAFATAPPRARHAMASLGARALLFGGANGTRALGDTWEWDPAAGGRPAALWRVPLPPAAKYGSVAVRAWAGARGRSEGGVEVAGAELLRWDVRKDSWQPLGRNEAATTPVALLEGELNQEEDVLGSVLGDEGEVVLAIRPRGANVTAPQMAEVGVDYLELTVHYQAGSEP
ncbi:MAG TPA: kelch repeat-containing protein [Myxococcales bacterium]